MLEIQTGVDFYLNHPSIEGHFPNNPIIPGVVILNSIIKAMENEFSIKQHQYNILNCKFVSPVVPPANMQIKFKRRQENRIDFTASIDELTVSLGAITINQK